MSTNVKLYQIYLFCLATMNRGLLVQCNHFYCSYISEGIKEPFKPMKFQLPVVAKRVSDIKKSLRRVLALVHDYFFLVKIYDAIKELLNIIAVKKIYTIFFKIEKEYSISLK